MEKKIQEELIRRVQPFLPRMRMTNLPVPSISDMLTRNNLKYIDDATIERMFNMDADSINFALEGAMDQLEFVMDGMSDMARLELLHDYPEITQVLIELSEYKNAPRTADNVKRLYNLTRYLNLPSRTFEMETPKELNNKLSKDFILKIEESFKVFLKNEEYLTEKLNNEKAFELKKRMTEHFELEQAIENKKLEERKSQELENNKKNNMPKSHPFLIKNKLTLNPFDKN